jgi:hypothetical protein
VVLLERGNWSVVQRRMPMRDAEERNAHVRSLSAACLLVGGGLWRRRRGNRGRRG